jgi:Domain of unknown function (DUF4430)
VSDIRSPLAAAVALVALAAAVAGCGLGAGQGTSGARLLVTRDFGRQTLLARVVQQVPGSETVMRLLERNARVDTRYGGGFVQSVDGLAGGREHGRPFDWFFYVNGVEGDRGSADVAIHAGDRVWWDRHDWTATETIPAVVGAFPEPFVHGYTGKRVPVTLECADHVEAACTTVAQRLADIGVPAGRQTIGTGVGQDVLRVIVGPWDGLRGDAAIDPIANGPAASGVYARMERGGHAIALLDPAGKTVKTLAAGAGLIAAVRYQDQAPTWTITGTDAAGVLAAARHFDEQSLRARFALAVPAAGGAIGVPVTK